jgi:hypothetical protein
MKTTILSLKTQQAIPVQTCLNDLQPHETLASYIMMIGKGGADMAETIQKYQLKTEPMGNGIDLCCWCEGLMLAAIKRAK